MINLSIKMISNRALVPVWIAFLILLLAVCAYWVTSDPVEPDASSVRAPVFAPREVVEKETAAGPEARDSEADQRGSPPELRPAESALARPRTIQTHELVAEYLRIDNVRDRGDLARSIASMDDAESLREIVTLFHRARHPDEREALIAALGDTDFSTELDGKLSLLASALVGQARNVRSAALGVVGRIEDPRAVALVKKIARTDPDHEVREAAKAFIAAE